MKKHFSEQELTEAITKGGRERQDAIYQLYNDRQFSENVIRFVQQNKGNFQDGQDIFHEGIIVLDRNIREGKYRHDAPLKSYLYSICRFLWMNQLRKQGRVNLVEDTLKMDKIQHQTPEVGVFEDEKKQFLDQLLAQLGDRCKRILELWKLSYSMEEIAQELGFSSEQMARKNKYRCHQRLLELVEDNQYLVKRLKE